VVFGVHLSAQAACGFDTRQLADVIRLYVKLKNVIGQQKDTCLMKYIRTYRVFICIFARINLIDKTQVP